MGISGSSFLDIKSVLSSWGKSESDRMKGYRKYVEDGLYKGVDNPFDLAVRQQVIGSETFAEEVAREHLLKRKVNDPIRTERAFKGETSDFSRRDNTSCR